MGNCTQIASKSSMNGLADRQGAFYATARDMTLSEAFIDYATQVMRRQHAGP